MSATKDFLHAAREGEKPSGNSYDAQRYWSQCPKLDAFRAEIGARIVSLRRAVVRENGPGGYHRIIGTLRIAPDGQVECDVPGCKLDDAQKVEMAKEIAAAKFPKSVPAPINDLPPQLCGVDRTEYFSFRNAEGRITFIQWRKNAKDGVNKSYVPFSYWSDGQWRMCEPDGPLPLYGIDRLKGARTVYLHEGPKAARFVQEMADAKTPAERERLQKHPWGHNLRHGVHTGWPGGALNADRVDWAPIKALSPRAHVTVVCDNDPMGINAAVAISRILKRPMTVIRFNDRFPVGFDLADAWPAHSDWWSTNGDYLGPLLLDLSSPATWATNVVITGSKGRPRYYIRAEFADEWIVVVDPPVFIHRRQPHIPLSDRSFDALVRPFSNAKNTSQLLRTVLSSQVDGLVYRPIQRRSK